MRNRVKTDIRVPLTILREILCSITQHRSNDIAKILRENVSLKEKFTQWLVECTWLSRGSYHRSFTGTRIIRFAKFTSRLVKIATIYSYTRLLRSRLELRLRLMLGSRLESGSSLTSHFAILARVLPY